MTEKSGPTQRREDELRAEGYQAIAGVDEAGRGPLAGPVVAAAVLLPEAPSAHLAGGVRDSKQLTARARNSLYDLIVREAVAYSAASVSPAEIDEMNILQASLEAMRRAVDGLEPTPGYVLVDGNKMPPILQDGEALVKGDQRSLSIAAASIVAKVVRDRMMDSYHQQYPQYGLDLHKGYPTAYHKAALRVFGSCSIHRNSFKGVSECLLVPPTRKEFAALHKRLARRQNVKSLTALLENVTEARRSLSEDEFLVLHDRVKRLLSEARSRSVTPERPTIQIGMEAEDCAAGFLEAAGFRIWERNYRAFRGEIDIVASHTDTIVFVEVRFRKGAEYGEPFETIGKTKQRAIFRTAERYLAERSLTEGWNVRFDVISITAGDSGVPQIEHFADAFRPGF